MKNVVFLTSSLELYEKDEYDNKIPKKFENKNKILTNLKKYIKKYDNFLYVASDEVNTEITDEYAKATFDSFDMTLPFKNYQVLDIRFEDKAKELVESADFIFLCGGHVPTQNEFFHKINLKELLEGSDAVVCGGSAGSMNCERLVYCPPELEGESIDPNFKNTLDGLGYTDINIFPHYEDMKDEILDGKKYLEDIIFQDSFERKIHAINDGSYFLIVDNKTYLYGECFLIENGDVTKINSNNKVIEL